MFDEYLQGRARTKQVNHFVPFDIATDYRLFVDGKPRFDGVRDFLRSRDIRTPRRNPGPTTRRHEAVAGLGNRKNDLVNEIIEEVGVQAYEGSVKCIHQLRQRGFKFAVVTSSQNCTAVFAGG